MKKKKKKKRENECFFDDDASKDRSTTTTTTQTWRTSLHLLMMMMRKDLCDTKKFSASRAFFNRVGIAVYSFHRFEHICHALVQSWFSV